MIVSKVDTEKENFIYIKTSLKINIFFSVTLQKMIANFEGKEVEKKVNFRRKKNIFNTNLKYNVTKEHTLHTVRIKSQNINIIKKLTS